MCGQYIPRLIDSKLELDLESFGAVYIRGPKWCGKTTTAEQFAKSAIYFGDQDKVEAYKGIAREKPSQLLKGETPRLIDEWQVATNLWDAVRFSVDHTKGKGLYILTGSVVVDIEKIEHSGTGRITTLRMGTMSLYEMGESTSEVSLDSLFNGMDVDGCSKHDLDSMASIVVSGGWPESVGKSEQVKMNIVQGYCEALVDMDVEIEGKKKRDPDKVRAILRSLSRHESAPVPNTRVYADARSTTEMHENTFDDYLSAIRSTNIIEDLSAWTPDLRSKATIRTKKIRHMADPAVSAYFLDAQPEDLLMDMNTYGLLFESLVVRDLRAYMEARGGRVYYYHDSDGLEVDAILHQRGRWAAIEIKLGSSEGIEEGVRSLKALRDKVDSAYRNRLAFMAVVTAHGYAYRREDGIYVVPIGCLAP